MMSRFDVTGVSITAEVDSAQAAEKTISDDLELTKQDAEDFKENVEGAFRDGIITETEAQTIERYIKELEKDNASIQDGNIIKRPEIRLSAFILPEGRENLQGIRQSKRRGYSR